MYCGVGSGCVPVVVVYVVAQEKVDIVVAELNVLDDCTELEEVVPTALDELEAAVADDVETLVVEDAADDWTVEDVEVCVVLDDDDEPPESAK